MLPSFALDLRRLLTMPPHSFRVLKSELPQVYVRVYKTYVRSIVESGTTVFNPMKKDADLFWSVRDNFTKKLMMRCLFEGIQHSPHGPHFLMMYKILANRLTINALEFFDGMLTRSAREKLILRISMHFLSSFVCPSHYLLGPKQRGASEPSISEKDNVIAVLVRLSDGIIGHQFRLTKTVRRNSEVIRPTTTSATFRKAYRKSWLAWDATHTLAG